MVNKLEISEMIDFLRDKEDRTNEEARQHEILNRLKILNWNVHNTIGNNWKRYHELWSKWFWKEARLLLKEYFTLDGKGILICPECKEIIENTQSFALHHSMYPKKSHNCFTPLYCSIVHNNKRCHKKGDPKK